MFIFLFLLVGIFAWIRMYYGTILLQTIKASANFQIACRMFQDNSLLNKQLDNVLYLFYFLSAGFVLYVAETRLHFLPYGLSGPRLYFINFGFLTGYFMARVVLVNLAGFLFNRTRIFREYLYNTFIFNKLLGITMVPLLVFVVYTTGILREVFQWTALVTVSAIFLMRIIRSIVFSFKKDVPIFYMFLYLCALELAPLALFYRWLEGIL
ncbi:MAG: DUF4271 domain-containing protein [Bacteroidota bacterium]